MPLLNFTVCEAGKVISPWSIKSVDPPNLTFKGFFLDLRLVDLELSQTYVGRAKDKLDLVDSDLVIADVTVLFGAYAKFLTSRKSSQPSTSGKLQYDLY